ncbi:MAG: HAD hydrolase-like protein, partial [Candidatus Omnitrophica bacterium]|nr:HAD hydrolase-like protein [Candidatus Omnitrophota bacterium]
FDVIIDNTKTPSGTKTEALRTAVNQMGLRTNECVAFDDSLRGLKEAKDAYMLCIGIDTDGKQGAQLRGTADLVLRALEDMKIGAIDELFKRKATTFVDPVTEEVTRSLHRALGVGEDRVEAILRSSMDSAESPKQEPKTAWESLLYYVQTGKFYFGIEDTFNTDNVAETRTSPPVDGIETYLTTSTYIDGKRERVYYNDDFLGLSAEEREGSAPVYIIHVPRKDFEGYEEGEGRNTFLARVLIRTWIEHFMPYFDGEIPDGYIPHERLFAPSQVQLSPVERTEKADDVRSLYAMLKDYYVFKDPAGTYKQAIFGAIEAIERKEGKGSLFLINNIGSPADLLAWYKYQFEHVGLSANTLSTLLEANRSLNRVIDFNLDEDNNGYLFNFTHPFTGQTIYIPQNMNLEDSEMFEAVELIPDAGERQQRLEEISRLEEERNSDLAKVAGLHKEKARTQAVLRGTADPAQNAMLGQQIAYLDQGISAANKSVHLLSQQMIYQYAEPVISYILRNAFNHPRQRCFTFGVYGGSSMGKTTLCNTLMELLYAKGRFDKTAGEVAVLGSDSCLHSGKDGRYIEQATENGVERFTALRGQGIYDVIEFRRMLREIRRGGSVKLVPDTHSQAYRPGQGTMVLGPGIKVMIVDVGVLAVDNNVLDEIDLLLPVVFADAHTLLMRQIVRDTRKKDEGGDRSLSVDSLIDKFIRFLLEENQEAMDRIVLDKTKAFMVWQQDRFRIFKRRQAPLVRDGDSVPIKGAIFDLDGVITSAEKVHFASWKRVFDGVFKEESGRTSQRPREFKIADYRQYLKSMTRYDGCLAILQAAEINEFACLSGCEHYIDRELQKEEYARLTPPQQQAMDRIRALGDIKNSYFNDHLDSHPEDSQILPGAVELLKELRASGVKIAVASSSRNANRILEIAGLT